MSNVKLVVDWCSHKAAKYAVMSWHYSKSMPTPPVIKIGAWEESVFVGCILFSRGANKNLGKAYGLLATEVCELTRVALGAHKSETSQIVSKAIKMLSKKESMRLIYSYADANEGHHGGIYQAMNWVYTGTTPTSFKYMTQCGRVLHQRQVSSTGWKPQYGEVRRVPKIDECEKIPQLGKHRYLYPLDRAMRRQIAPLARPYPKRDSCEPSIEGDTPSVQDGRAGSTPAVRSDHTGTQPELTE